MKYLLAALLLGISSVLMLIFLMLDIHSVYQWVLGYCSGLIVGVVMVLDK